MKIRFKRHTVHSIRKTPREVRYYGTFYAQPTWRYLIAKVYHAYDMNKIVHWVAHRFPEYHAGSGIMLPRCAKQDERCYKLSIAGRTQLAEIEVDQETYEKLGKLGE